MGEGKIIKNFISFDLLSIDEYGLPHRHKKHLEMIHKISYNRYDNKKMPSLLHIKQWIRRR